MSDFNQLLEERIKIVLLQNNTETVNKIDSSFEEKLSSPLKELRNSVQKDTNVHKNEINENK